MSRSNARDLESIGRFSRRAGIPVSHLRHYHEAGLLEPAYVDPESGYRYYAAAQREAAEVIAMLRSIDMPVREIQRVLADPSEATVGEVLTTVAGRLEAIDRIVKEGIFVKQPTQVAEDGFVPVRVESVQAHTPTTERWRELREKLPRHFSEEPQEVHVVLLVADNGRHIPLWVGGFEGQAIQLHLDGLKTERPLTYDLILDAFSRHGVSVLRADVLRVVDGVFFATLITKSGDRVEKLDCRPSDALNIALRADAPIAVAQTLLDEAGVDAGSDLAN
jgi:bifunctional DNase/RNase